MPNDERTGVDSKNSVSNQVNPRIHKPMFTNNNGQANGKRRLIRMEFHLGNKEFRFSLNPEEYTQQEPSRINVTQTKAGAWVDDFGGGIQTIGIKGTTGFKGSVANGDHGFLKFKELRDLIREYYFDIIPGTPITRDNELIFHNYTDGEHWIVVPKTFNLLRSVARPLLYLYEIELICIRAANEPLQIYTSGSEEFTGVDAISYEGAWDHA